MTHLPENLRARGRLALALFFTLPLLVACGPIFPPKPVVAPSLVQSPGQKSVAVSQDKSGASIVLESAQELIVSLPLDLSTGSEWRLADLKPGVLALQSANFVRALRNTNDDGGAGATVWRFLPAGAGDVALKFELKRPRSLDPAVRTVTYIVTVK